MHNVLNQLGRFFRITPVYQKKPRHLADRRSQDSIRASRLIMETSGRRLRRNLKVGS